MRQSADDPFHRPRHVSLYFHFGVGMLGPGILILLVRLLAIPPSQPLLRFALTGIAMVAAVPGVILVAIAAARSWGARGLVTSTLITGIVTLLGCGTVLVLDSIPVPKAFTKWAESLNSDSEDETHPAAIEAAKPISSDENTLRYVDVFEHYDGWIQRHMIEPYDRHATNDPARDEAARAVIRNTVRNSFYHPARVPSKKLTAWTKKALGDGGTDPIVQVCAMEHEYDPTVFVPILQAAEKSLAARGDAPAVLFFARLSLWTYEVRAKPDDKIPPGLVIESLADAIRSGPLDESEAWAWGEVIRWGYRANLLNDHGEDVLKAIEPLTARHAWLKHHIRGHIAMAQASKLPGYGLESAKDPLFKKHYETARDEFLKGWDLNPKYPGSASAMILVFAAIGESPERESREWFDRVTRLYIDYPEAYWRYRLTLRSFWRGTYGAMEEFAWACEGTERYDTNVPIESLRTYQWLSQMSPDSAGPFRDEGMWEDFREIIDNYLWVESDEDQWHYWASVGAVVAHRCGESEACLGYLEQLGFDLNDVAARDWGLDAETWAAQTAAEMGPASGPVLVAKLEEENGIYTDAIESLSAALKLPHVCDPARRYLETKISRIEAMKRLQEVEWAPMFESGTLEGWEIGKGNGTVPSSGVVEAKGELTMIMNKPAGNVFEVRGEIELKGTRKYVPGGFAIGQPFPGRSDWESIQIRQFIGGKMGVLLDPERYYYGGRWSKASFKPRTQFHLRVIGDRCLLSLDGATVLDERIEEPAAMKADSRLALLANGEDSEAVVRWHSLEWRRP